MLAACSSPESVDCGPSGVFTDDYCVYEGSTPASCPPARPMRLEFANGTLCGRIGDRDIPPEVCATVRCEAPAADAGTDATVDADTSCDLVVRNASVLLEGSACGDASAVLAEDDASVVLLGGPPNPNHGRDYSSCIRIRVDGAQLVERDVITATPGTASDCSSWSAVDSSDPPIPLELVLLDGTTRELDLASPGEHAIDVGAVTNDVFLCFSAEMPTYVAIIDRIRVELCR